MPFFPRLLISLFFLFSLLSCSTANKPLAIPSATEGGWKQTSNEPVDASRKPEWLSRLGLKESRSVKYSGNIDIQADFYELNSDASALECMQLWKRAPAESVLLKGNLFIVLRSNHPNREMLMDFSRALEKAL